MPDRSSHLAGHSDDLKKFKDKPFAELDQAEVTKPAETVEIMPIIEDPCAGCPESKRGMSCKDYSKCNDYIRYMSGN